MITQEVTPELLAAWKAAFDCYRHRLKPDRKTGPDLLAYLEQNYSLTEITGTAIQTVVSDNILLNKCHAQKLSPGKSPVPKGFFIENTGAGKILYENQDDLFRGIRILAGLDLETGFFLVEGSSRLWDELFAFRGLDADDLANPYLVAEYISCHEKAGTLDAVLAP